MKKILTILGVVLIILSLFGFSQKYLSYNTNEKVAEVGNVKITAEKENIIYLSPTTSAIMLGVGLFLVVVGFTRKS
jgi:cell division protein FtsL